MTSKVSSKKFSSLMMIYKINIQDNNLILFILLKYNFLRHGIFMSKI